MSGVLDLLLSLPAVQEVSVTSAHGQVQKYNVKVKLDGTKAEELAKLWPFGIVVTDGEHAVGDFVVKPTEVEDFCARFSGVAGKPVGEVALVFQLPYPPSEEQVRRVEASVRSGDHVIWRDGRLVVVLRNCREEGISAVQERVRRALRLDQVTVSVRAAREA